MSDWEHISGLIWSVFYEGILLTLQQDYYHSDSFCPIFAKNYKKNDPKHKIIGINYISKRIGQSTFQWRANAQFISISPNATYIASERRVSLDAYKVIGLETSATHCRGIYKQVHTIRI